MFTCHKPAKHIFHIWNLESCRSPCMYYEFWTIYIHAYCCGGIIPHIYRSGVTSAMFKLVLFFVHE